jgi:sulfite exporter TauE/SafE
MDTELLIPALVMGLAGSLHCIGMCGPIALALPLQGSSRRQKLLGGLLYNAGRVSTYAIFGFLFGWLGGGLKWFGWQQRMSLSLGVIMLLFMIVPHLLPTGRLQCRINNGMSAIRQTLANMLFKGTPTAMFATGLLNGLLPCGLVYMALAGSAVSGSPWHGTLFMAMFGIGTTPIMLSSVWMGGMLHRQLRTALRKAYPAMLVTMSILLIIRGLDLGIPYLSPSLRPGNSAEAHCIKN